MPSAKKVVTSIGNMLVRNSSTMVSTHGGVMLQNHMMDEQYAVDSHEERWRLCSDLLAGRMGHERSQLFSLFHSRGIYEHQRSLTQDKRVVNLTRSSYAGQQRYATITWNGDTYASWKSFAQMIPAGLSSEEKILEVMN